MSLVSLMHIAFHASGALYIVSLSSGAVFLPRCVAHPVY